MPFVVTKDPVERTCCVPICNNQKFNLTHKFPKNNKRCEEWLIALNIPHLNSIPKHKLLRSYFVCTRHFRNEDYKFETSRYLNTTAIPSINIKDLSQLYLVASRLPNSFDEVIGENENTSELCTEDQNAVLSESRGSFYIEIEECQNEEFSTEDLNKTSLKSSLKNNDDFKIAKKKQKIDTDEYIRRNSQEKNIEIGISSGDECDESEYISAEFNIKEDNSYVPTLSINHPKYDEPVEVDLFWLRDHCKCDLCYNYDTYQRRTNIMDISLNIYPIVTEFMDDKLYIKWDDDHESHYEIDFLFKSQNILYSTKERIDYYLWDKIKIEKNDGDKYAEVDFGNYLSDDKTAITVIASILKFGFAFIKNVPATTDMTEMTVKRLFPIQKTLFGEMWTFTNNKDKADTAYTAEYLGPHNDNTYFCDAAGLQVFHCIKKSGNGGSSIFVDGFNAIEILNNEDPKCLDILSTVNVPAEYIDKDQHHKYSAPIIELDTVTSEPIQIRFNLYDRSDFIGINLKKTRGFYKSLKHLTQIVNDENNIFKFELVPGTVVIFNNWRILHGREEFTGERVITGCYVSRTDFMSKARSLGLID